MHAKHVAQCVLNYLIFLIIMCEGCILQGVYFIVSLFTGTVSHRKPLSAGNLVAFFFHRSSTDLIPYWGALNSWPMQAFSSIKLPSFGDNIKWTPV